MTINNKIDVIEKGYTCTLHSIDYYGSDTPNAGTSMDTRTPNIMHGTFQYIGKDPFEFKARFCPMGGIWVSIKLPSGRLVPLRDMAEERHRDIGNAALSIALNNRTATEPQDFQWTKKKYSKIIHC